MFKVLIWARRRADLSLEAFRECWLAQHAPLVKVSLPGLRRYVVHPVIAVPRGEAPFDGVAELVFDDRDAFVAAMRSDGGRRTALDLERFARETGVVFTEEHVVVD
jgi:uncharacterized protein (TIGR02118 family)